MSEAEYICCPEKERVHLCKTGGAEPVHLCKTEGGEPVHLCKTGGAEPVQPVQNWRGGANYTCAKLEGRGASTPVQD
ncbi:unnamed protein product [Staurois parvus]|uniref:Uncharacterized protein n=1 Tax=Staurois parvus TaxID=386267 RepID=A0ABN9FZ53_9NEOB|nr:unnamed protein product [Staurois parvus]